MNQNIHRINDIIKQVSDLRYDASTGWFETDRRALYDFAVLVVKECCQKLENDGMVEVAMEMKEYFGVNMNDQDYDEQGGERGWAER